MKLYKIRGTSEWVPWDVLYNERGYNSVPCIDMEYKSISPWGTSAGTGYRTNGAGAVTYFVSGETGWRLAFSLPEDFGVYPDEATPIQMIKDGVVSDAVWMEFFGSKWYLIQAEIANERYWIHELALPEYGWEIYEGKDYEFILVDGTTGRVVHGVEQLNEMVFAPTGYFTIEDTGDIVFVEQSPYPIVSRFHVDFDAVQTLADGAHIDTVLPYYTSKLYIAGIVNRVAETIVDFGLTVSNEGGYVRVTNNTGANVTLTRLAIQSMDATDAEVVEVVDGQDNHAYAFKWDDGGTPYWWISYSGERHWTSSLGNWSEVPSVVLPTVTQLGSYGLISGTMSVPSNDSTPELRARDGAYFHGSGIEYDRTRRYAITKYSDGTELKTPVNIFDVTWIQSGTSPFLMAVKNVSTISQTFYSARVAECSDSTATVVTVYDSSNVAYNAFKYTASGTDYYYVLDGTQTDWTDDLASIGYSLTPAPVLPTVTVKGDFGGYNWLYSQSGQTTYANVSAGDFHDVYYSGATVTYDYAKCYAIQKWFTTEATSGYEGINGVFSVINNNGSIALKNESSTEKSIFSARIAVCSDSTATVVTVYNASNVAYNAFKFTASGTDYYYVLDGTQTNWTDDLASIGYYLHTSEFDIDTNWGTTVAIPSGYSVQSVKASRAYAVGIADEYSVNYIKFHITGEDVYCTDTDTSLLGCGVDPVIGLFQITTINSQGSYSGYHLTYRSSQTTAQAARSIEYPSLNSGGNFVQLTAVNNTDNVLYNSVRPAMVDGKPLIIRKYDSSGSIISYYLNVPQALWSFQNGVFSWLGDSTSQSDLAYFYYNLQVRIHCVRI